MIRADNRTLEVVMERRRHRLFRQHHHPARSVRRMQAHLALENHLFAAG
ncbi:hypothetical protein [Antrihabitans stalactiti]|nr:hypothetical protein [Antrihabitans stalactiti]